MAEILAPQRLDVSHEYRRGFEGMVEHPVSLKNPLKAREDLIQEIVGRMPEPHKRFLISVKKGQPEWTLLDLSGANDLPAVHWKLDNLAKLSSDKRAELLKGLNEALSFEQA